MTESLAGLSIKKRLAVMLKGSLWVTAWEHWLILWLIALWQSLTRTFKV
jgi:hypothetical protein